jgi:hypothetical protein
MHFRETVDSGAAGISGGLVMEMKLIGLIGLTVGILCTFGSRLRRATVIARFCEILGRVSDGRIRGGETVVGDGAAISSSKS